MNFEVESGKSIKLLTKNKVCAEDITIAATGGGGGGGDSGELLRKRLTNTLEHLELDLQGGSIVERAFNTCSSLKTVKLYNVGRLVGSYIFYLCSGLETAELAFETKNSAAFLPTFTFRECGAKTIILKNCYRIEGSVFQSAKNLGALILPDTDFITTLGNTNALSGTPIASGTGYVYVPKALLSDDDATKDYRRATNWVTYKDQFRAKEDYPEILEMLGGAE